MEDLSNKKFGRLTVIDFAGRNKFGQTQWNCICECGISRVVASFRLKQGTRSCGCLSKDVSTKMKTTHNMSGSKTYNSWQAMMRRCYDKSFISYKDYGNKNIKVDKDWHNFENFLKDMGERPEGMSIDRIDPNKDYYKENCKWSSMEEQANNKKNTIILEYNNKKQTLIQWSKELNISYQTLKNRINNGWSIEKAFTTPVNIQKQYNKNKSSYNSGILIEYNRQSKTFKEWSEIYNIPIHTLRARLKKNNNIVDDSIFEKLKSKSKMITLNGKTHNVTEWSNIIGISMNSFKERMDKGLSDDEMLKPPTK